MAHRVLTMASLLVLSLTVAAAATSAADDAADPLPGAEPGIEARPWLLVAQSVDRSMTPVPADVVVSLFMDAGEANGTGGCNRYSGSYQLDGSELAFGDIRSTLMFCQGPAGEVERAYLTNLAVVTAFAGGDEQLMLLDDAGAAVLQFDAAPSATIVGDWQALAITSGSAVVSSAETPTSAVTATFAEDGQLSGSDGCGRYRTPYTIEADRIDIAEPLATTRAACPTEALADQSAAYFAALSAAATWSVTVDGWLELRDDSGALQVRFLPASDPA